MGRPRGQGPVDQLHHGDRNIGRQGGVSFVFSSQWPTSESAIPAGALRDESSRLVLGSDHGAGHALLEEISGGTDMYRPQKRQSLYEPLGGPSAVVLISSF
jgi:hypothetical protein